MRRVGGAGRRRGRALAARRRRLRAVGRRPGRAASLRRLLAYAGSAVDDGVRAAFGFLFETKAWLQVVTEREDLATATLDAALAYLGDDASPPVVEQVAALEERRAVYGGTSAAGRYRRAHRALEHEGLTPEVEALLREAADAGSDDAWYAIGYALDGRPGRTLEAERAYRAAARSEAPEVAEPALMNLGGLLLFARADLVGAQACFRRALTSRDGSRRDRAAAGLAMCAGQAGDRAATTAAITELVRRHFDTADVEDDWAAAVLTTTLAGLFLRPRARRVILRWNAGRRRLELLQRRLRYRRRLRPGQWLARAAAS